MSMGVCSTQYNTLFIPSDKAHCTGNNISITRSLTQYGASCLYNSGVSAEETFSSSRHLCLSITDDRISHQNGRSTYFCRRIKIQGRNKDEHERRTKKLSIIERERKHFFDTGTSNDHSIKFSSRR